jgi:UTP--glucose-1-phosphate uridylyltransferase
MYGDDIMDSKKTSVAQLMEVYDRYQDPVIGLYRVPKKEISGYGVVAIKPADGQAVEVTGFVEKPSPEKAPSDLAAAGRYIITPEIFDMLERVRPGKDGEIRLADAFVEFLRHRSLYGCIIDATRHDCGTKLGLLKAQIAYGLKHPDISKPFKKYLSHLNENLGIKR